MRGSASLPPSPRELYNYINYIKLQINLALNCGCAAVRLSEQRKSRIEYSPAPHRFSLQAEP